MKFKTKGRFFENFQNSWTRNIVEYAISLNYENYKNIIMYIY